MSGFEVLCRSPLFTGLPKEDLQALASRLGRRSFARGMILFHRDSLGQMLYLIESGKVRIFILSDAGQEMTLDVHGPGECFGEVSLLDGRPRPAGAVALEQTVTYLLQRDDFFGCLQAHPILAHRIIDLVVERYRQLTLHAETLAFLDVPGRLAVVLLELAERHGVRCADQSVEIVLHLTQAELATWVGATREMVNRALSAFRERGCIRIEGQTITIVDPQRLAQKVAH